MRTLIERLPGSDVASGPYVVAGPHREIYRKPVTMRQFGLFTGVRNIHRKPLTMRRIGCLGEGIEDQRSGSGAGEDHFVRALLVGNVATVALCGQNEEALATLNRLAHEPASQKISDVYRKPLTMLDTDIRKSLSDQLFPGITHPHKNLS